MFIYTFDVGDEKIKYIKKTTRTKYTFTIKDIFIDQKTRGKKCNIVFINKSIYKKDYSKTDLSSDIIYKIGNTNKLSKIILALMKECYDNYNDKTAMVEFTKNGRIHIESFVVSYNRSEGKKAEIDYRLKNIKISDRLMDLVDKLNSIFILQ